jgi:hypothetical protein
MFYIYLEEPSPTGTVMKAAEDLAGRDAVPPVTPAEVASADIRQSVRREVGARWDRFSPQELSALANRDDLVREVASRYGVEKSEAQREVDSVLKGRRI